MSSDTETAGKSQARKEKDNLSKRQARKEEMRRKSRQQRMLVIGGVGLVALMVVALFILPAMRKATNSEVPPFVKITPVAYQDADSFHLGDPNAKVKVEVFEDFDCSACRTYALSIEPDVIKNLVETGQVYYTFYQFPFLDDRSADKPSDRSANAALCAAEQNRFWDYKNLLFTNQGIGFNDPTLIAMADSLNLNASQFKACYNAKKFQGTVDEHTKLGVQYNVQGTPSVFVNGQIVSPGHVPTFAEIQAAVQAAAK